MSTVIFDGQGNMPELNRITAKKNYASSSQSHKMGATAMFNDILHYLAKEKYPSLLNKVEGNVAVRQHPVYAFEKIKLEGKENQYRRKFIGLFTVGPDKGDKGFFGFTNEAVKDKAIRLEGTDHLKGVGFNYPWEVNGVKNIRYNADKEALCIVTGSDATNWTAIFEQSYCGNKKTEADIEAYLEEKYKPAYEVAYYNNPLIVGVDKTIEEINSDIEAFGKLRRTSDDRQYSFCEFWIDGEYDIYYLNQERNIYEKNGINILTDLGISEEDIADLSIDEKNELFIQKRVERFKEECPKKFNKEDAIFQLMILFIMVASDNFEKNMYPYIMDLLWRFFQDDLDSIFSTDNQAQDTKKYSAELHDFTDDTHSAYVFKGEDSAFWQLIELAYPAECKKMGYDILQAMYDMASRGTTTTEKLMSFFEDYFFDRAQDYFTPSAYNNDTEYSYEEAWNNKEYVAEVDIHPLAQALGGHEVTERAFLEKRIIFLMSKFGFGGFSSAEDTALGLISFRTQVEQSFTLTPAIDMYPTMLLGQAKVVTSDKRVMAGESVALPPIGGGNTNIYIAGADWLSDIGDLKDLKIDPSSVVTLSIASKRLRRLKVGDENAEAVTSYLAALSVQQCDSLESIDARNLKTLIGTVDLSKCPRLIEALFGGTNTTAIIISPGSKIEKLQLPDSVTTIDLRNTKFLEDVEIGNLANVRFLRLEGVPTLNGFAVLKEAYNSDGQQLKDIRLVGFTYNGDATDIDMLANIATDKDKYGNSHLYNGIDNNGNPINSNPIIEGNLNIDGYVYEETATIVEQQFPTIIFTPKGYYMRFQDPEVLDVLLANMSELPEGATGITAEQAAAVTSIGAWFKGNTAIETFDEFEKFTGVTIINSAAFCDCNSLKSIILPESVTIIDKSIWGNSKEQGAFRDCTSLESINISHLTNIRSYAFYNCESLVIEDLRLPKLKEFHSTSFYKVNIHEINDLGDITTLPTPNNNNTRGYGNQETLRKVVIPSAITSIPKESFYGYSAIKDFIIDWSKITSIGYSAFQGCTSLSFEELNLPNLTSLGQNAFNGVKIKKLVLGKLTDLPTATSNSQHYGDKNVLETVVLPDSITSIGEYSFYGYNALREIILPSGLLSFAGRNIFNGCSSLSFDAANLPKSITTVGYMALNGFTGLYGELSLPNLTTIGEGAFRNTKISKVLNLGKIESTTEGDGNGGTFGNCTSLKHIELPETLRNLNRAFLYNCPNIETMIVHAVAPPNFNTTQNSVGAAIYVPDASVEAYRTATNWSTYASRIFPITLQNGTIIDGYVQDRILLWLDGINKGNTEGAWSSLIGSGKFVNYGATELPNGYEFDGTSYLADSDSYLWGYSNTRTLEAVIETYENSDNAIVFAGANNGDFGLGLFTSSGTIAVSMSVSQPSFDNILTGAKKAIVTIVGNLMYVNGVSYGFTKNASISNEDGTYYIGRRGTGLYFKGKIHALRIHGRTLTEDEVMSNQRQDNIRFNLGIDL